MSVVLQNVCIECLKIRTTFCLFTPTWKLFVGFIDCCIYEKNAIKLKHALDLYQSVQAKLWSTSPYVARQIDGIGPQFAKHLAKANLISIDQLKHCDPGHIEMVSSVIFGTL
jgi:hypothetical protein